MARRVSAAISEASERSCYGRFNPLQILMWSYVCKVVYEIQRLLWQNLIHYNRKVEINCIWRNTVGWVELYDENNNVEVQTPVECMHSKYFDLISGGKLKASARYRRKRWNVLFRSKLSIKKVTFEVHIQSEPQNWSCSVISCNGIQPLFLFLAEIERTMTLNA